MNEPNTDGQTIAELRGLLTQTLHGVCDDAPLVDCARLSNLVFDDAQDGDYNSVKAVICLLKTILNDGRTVTLDMVRIALALVKIQVCDAEVPRDASQS